MKTRRSFFKQCLGAIAAGLGVGGAIKSMPKGFEEVHAKDPEQGSRGFEAGYRAGYRAAVFNEYKRLRDVKMARLHEAMRSNYFAGDPNYHA